MAATGDGIIANKTLGLGLAAIFLVALVIVLQLSVAVAQPTNSTNSTNSTFSNSTIGNFTSSNSTNSTNSTLPKPAGISPDLSNNNLTNSSTQTVGPGLNCPVYQPPYLSATPSPVLQGQSETLSVGPLYDITCLKGASGPYTESYTATNAMNGATIASYSYTGNSPGSYTFTVPSNPSAMGSIDASGSIRDAQGASISGSSSFQIWQFMVTISPSSTTIDLGESTTLNVTASGATAPYHYQWYTASGAGTCTTSDTKINGAANAVYVATPSASTYYCVVATDSSNPAKVQGSSTALVSVDSALGSPTITPAPATYDNGQTVTLTASDTGGTAPYSYQWYNYTSGTGVAIAGATNSTYTEPAHLTSNYIGSFVFHYGARVTDSASPPENANSPAFGYIVNPAFTGGGAPIPPYPNLDVGQGVTLSVSAGGGTPPYTYQWYEGQSLTCTSDSAIPGATAQSYNASPSSDTYYCASETDNATTPVTIYTSADGVKVNPAPTATMLTPNASTVIYPNPVAYNVLISNGWGPFTVNLVNSTGFVISTINGASAGVVTFGVFTPPLGTDTYKVVATDLGTYTYYTFSSAPNTITVIPKPPLAAQEPAVLAVPNFQASGEIFDVGEKVYLSPTNNSLTNPAVISAAATGGTAPYSFSYNVVNAVTGAVLSNTFVITAASNSYSTAYWPNMVCNCAIVSVVTDNSVPQQTSSSAQSNSFIVNPAVSLGVPVPSSTWLGANQPVTFTDTFSGGTGPFTFNLVSNGVTVNTVNEPAGFSGVLSFGPFIPSAGTDTFNVSGADLGTTSTAIFNSVSNTITVTGNVLSTLLTVSNSIAMQTQYETLSATENGYPMGPPYTVTFTAVNALDGNSIFTSPLTPLLVIYVGRNVTTGPWTVQVTTLGAPVNGISPAALNIYYNGALTNTTQITPVGGAVYRSGTHYLYISVEQTFAGLYAYQKWARLQLFSYVPSVSVVTSTLPANLTFQIANTPDATGAIVANAAINGTGTSVVALASNTFTLYPVITNLLLGPSTNKTVTGEPISFNASFTGGNPSYQLSLFNASGIAIQNATVSGSPVLFNAVTPSSAGNYTYTVKGVDIGLTTPAHFSMNATVHVVNRATLMLVMGPGPSVTQGQTESFLATANNGVGPFLVQIINTTLGVNTVVGNFMLPGPGPSNGIATTAFRPGNYTYQAVATDLGVSPTYNAYSGVGSLSVKPSNTAACNSMVTLWTEDNATCNKFAVQLFGFGTANGNGVVPALLNIYYNGRFYGLVTAYPPNVTNVSVGSARLTLNLSQTAYGLNYVQQWAHVNLSVTHIPYLSVSNASVLQGQYETLNESINVTSIAPPYTYSFNVNNGFTTALTNTVVTNSLSAAYTFQVPNTLQCNCSVNAIVTGSTPNAMIVSTGLMITYPAPTVSVSGFTPLVLGQGEIFTANVVGGNGPYTLRLAYFVPNTSYGWIYQSMVVRSPGAYTFNLIIPPVGVDNFTVFGTDTGVSSYYGFVGYNTIVVALQGTAQPVLTVSANPVKQGGSETLVETLNRALATPYNYTFYVVNSITKQTIANYTLVGTSSNSVSFTFNVPSASGSIGNMIATAIVSIANAPIAVVDTNTFTVAPAQTGCTSNCGGGIVGGGGGGGGGAPGPSTFKPVINATGDCYVVSNLAPLGEFAVTTKGSTVVNVTENFISPDYAGITVDNNQYTIYPGKITSAADSLPNLTVELLNISYLPILKTITLEMCYAASPAAVNKTKPSNTTTTTVPPTSSSVNTSVTTPTTTSVAPTISANSSSSGQASPTSPFAIQAVPGVGGVAVTGAGLSRFRRRLMRGKSHDGYWKNDPKFIRFIEEAGIIEAASFAAAALLFVYNYPLLSVVAAFAFGISMAYFVDRITSKHSGTRNAYVRKEGLRAFVEEFGVVETGALAVTVYLFIINSYLACVAFAFIFGVLLVYLVDRIREVRNPLVLEEPLPIDKVKFRKVKKQQDGKGQE